MIRNILITAAGLLALGAYSHASSAERGQAQAELGRAMYAEGCGIDSRALGEITTERPAGLRIHVRHGVGAPKVYVRSNFEPDKTTELRGLPICSERKNHI